MQQPRITVKWIMVVVAIVGVVLGVVVRLKALSDGYRRLAYFHGAVSNGAMMDAVGYGDEAGRETEAAQAHALELYHLGLMRRYDHLVYHPWESRPADPLASQLWETVLPPNPLLGASPLSESSEAPEP